jgi:hypothetical protein
VLCHVAGNPVGGPVNGWRVLVYFVVLCHVTRLVALLWHFFSLLRRGWYCFQSRPPPGAICVYAYALKAFPLHPFFSDALFHFKLAPIQITPTGGASTCSTQCPTVQCPHEGSTETAVAGGEDCIVAFPVLLLCCLRGKLRSFY